MCSFLDKDVLAPAATILAAIVAAGVTIVFQRRQYELAKNKLKLDLFDKKYNILKDAKDLLSLILNDCYDVERMRKNTNDIRRYYGSIAESRFLLSAHAVDFLKKCEEDCERFLMAISAKQIMKDDQYKTHVEHIARLVTVLRDDYACLPAKFENDLRIEA